MSGCLGGFPGRSVAGLRPAGSLRPAGAGAWPECVGLWGLPRDDCEIKNPACGVRRRRVAVAQCRVARYGAGCSVLRRLRRQWRFRWRNRDSGFSAGRGGFKLRIPGARWPGLLRLRGMEQRCGFGAGFLISWSSRRGGSQRVVSSLLLRALPDGDPRAGSEAVPVLSSLRSAP